MSVAIREILKEKVLTKKPTEMRSIEEMIKGKGAKKKILTRSHRQKLKPCNFFFALIFFYYYYFLKS